LPGPTSDSGRFAWILGTTAIVFAAWVVPAANIGVAFFLAVPVGLTAWWYGTRTGIVAAIAAAGVYAFGTIFHHVSRFGAALAIRFVAFLLVALLTAAARDRLAALERSEEELKAIRAALAPSALPELPDVDAAAAFVPSELGVSGDFYLLTNGPDGSTLAIVGDVAGHGPRAARLATFVRGRFVAFAASTSDPAELLTLANTALIDQPRSQRLLVSAVCLRFAPGGGSVSWAVAGHPHPLRLPGLRELDADGETFLLGADAHLALENTETAMGEEEGMLLYTDGATDVRRGEETLGLAGLRGVLGPLARRPAGELADEAEKAILTWADRPIRDDLCLLVLKPALGGRR
jgi:serine phosphatase RsbU (regulator of sigma subunit)